MTTPAECSWRNDDNVSEGSFMHSSGSSETVVHRVTLPGSASTPDDRTSAVGLPDRAQSYFTGTPPPSSDPSQSKQAPAPQPPPQAKTQTALQVLAQRARQGLAALNAMTSANGVTGERAERQVALQRVEEVIRKVPWLLPDSRMRRAWDCTVLTVCLAQTVMAPLVFAQLVPMSVGVLLVFWFLSALGGVDAAIRWNTVMVRHEEIITHKPRQLGMLLLDLLTSVPLDCIAAAAGVGGLTLRSLSLPRVLSALRVHALFQLSNPGAIDPDYVHFYFNWVPALKFMFRFVLSIHFLTVVKVLLAAEHDDDDSDTWNDGRYDYSLFWVWNLLTTSPANLTLNTYPQRVFCFLLMCCGVVFQGVIVGQVSLMLIKSGVREQNEQKMRTTLDIVSHYNLPRSLKQEVLSVQWHTLQSSLNFLSNTGHIFGRLPALMRTEVMIYIKIDFVGKCAMFSEAKHLTKVRLASSLRQQFRQPGEEIIVKGDVGSETYFILHGFCEVLIEGVGCVAVLKRGDFFGEVALLVDTPRTATIRTLTYCDFFVLHRTAFSQICDLDSGFELGIRQRMHAKLPADKQQANAARMAELMTRQRDAGTPRRCPSSPTGEDGGRRRTMLNGPRGSVDSCDSASDNVESVVHQLALQQTQQQQQQMRHVNDMLANAKRERERPRERRKSGGTLHKIASGSLAQRVAAGQGRPPPLPASRATVSPAPAPPRRTEPRPSVFAIPAMQLPSPAEPPAAKAPALGQSGAHSPTLSACPNPGGSPLGLQRKLSTRQKPNEPQKSPRMSAIVAHAGLAMSMSASVEADQSKPAGGAAGTPTQERSAGVRQVLNAMSTDEKISFILDRQELLWSEIGGFLEGMSKRQEDFADDVFTAVNKVEEQVWVTQDLVSHCLERLDRSGDKKPAAGGGLAQGISEGWSFDPDKHSAEVAQYASLF